MFRSSIPPLQKQAGQAAAVLDAPAKAAAFARTYAQILDALTADPWADIPGFGSAEINCVRLCRLREECLRQAGFGDIFADVKQSENDKALALLPEILRDIDSVDDAAARMSKVVWGVFAGNVFDLGAAASAKLFEEAGSSFVRTRESLVTRPWVVDDFDAVLEQLLGHCYSKALVFVDNAGSDVILGILPLARALTQRGTQVILTANSVHSINDVTATELTDILRRAAALDPVIRRAVAEEALTVTESGNDLPVLDLLHVSPALVSASQDTDLVILEGMGRAIETNLDAKLTCDKMNFGMIKHPEVAAMLGGRLYDCVCKYTRGTEKRMKSLLA